MIFQQLVTSFFASGAFGIIFNVPKNALVKCSFTGMVGWIIYFILIDYHVNSVFATFIGAFVVASISQIFAKIYRNPVIIFSVSGIIPLVPGGLAYDAMRHVVENDYNSAIALATKSFMLSGAIAMGLVFSEVINQTIKKSKGSVKSLK